MLLKDNWCCRCRLLTTNLFHCAQCNNGICKNKCLTKKEINKIFYLKYYSREKWSKFEISIRSSILTNLEYAYLCPKCREFKYQQKLKENFELKYIDCIVKMKKISFF